MPTRPSFEDHEDLTQQPDDAGRRDTELTLSATTLLLLFFALVVVCGLFFGLGYTLGRREPAAVQGRALSAQPGATLFGHAKPSATQQNQPQHSAAPLPPPPDSSATQTAYTQAADPRAADSAQQLAQSDTVRPALPTTEASTASSPAPNSTTPATSATASGIMVQIAAVSDQADANVLVSALRKRGYAVSVSRIPGDALMHVQVGPFANRNDASAMRQKLLNDGYNAILR